MKKLKNKPSLKQLQLYLQKNTSHLDQLPTKKDFVLWVNAALCAAAESLDQNIKNTEITIRLVDEQESAELNQQYRHKTGPTNILSFPAKNIPDSDLYYLGDLVICVPLVFQEAIEQEKTSIAHWAHLTVHGTLHLLGYDHIQEHEAAVMEKLEIDILKQLGYENPYICL